MNAPLTTTSSVPDLARTQLDFILLDGSGSMCSKWFDTLAGIDAYVASLRDANIQSLIKLSVFTTHGFENTLSMYTAREFSVSDWLPLRDHPIGAHFGSTPLYDAINSMGRELHDLNPTRCAITIVTDGEENMSKTTRVQARSILDWCRAKGWQVTFIGAEFDNRSTAAQLGGTPTSCIGVNMKHLPDATRSLAKKRANYALSGSPMHWTEDEQQQFGGYLASPDTSTAAE